ncbi:UDP-glucose:glycoprotein glucosyltransferases [Striga asiatica]|uniref:UDP-glucose:glycoprotein glucosyltransferases n=1 Tax=Striga asiatica TaxID=4170 RepID=A0A5A7P685_STRAF|nr:UDP-glucose:glycoprotein glucosyltransferases [Striga asiatica]
MASSSGVKGKEGRLIVCSGSLVHPFESMELAQPSKPIAKWLKGLFKLSPDKLSSSSSSSCSTSSSSFSPSQKEKNIRPRESLLLRNCNARFRYATCTKRKENKFFHSIPHVHR